TRKSGSIDATSSGYAPTDWLPSITSAAPACRAAAPTRGRSTSRPSVQWQFGTETTAVVESIASIRASVQAPADGVATVRTTAARGRARSRQAYTFDGNSPSTSTIDCPGATGRFAAATAMP